VKSGCAESTVGPKAQIIYESKLQRHDFTLFEIAGIELS